MARQKIRGIIRLFRPELPFAAGVCVVLGELIALGSFPSFRETVLGFACGFFMSSSALILNDYFDLEVDRVNAPERPLPSGAVSPSEAVYLTAFTTFIAFATAFIIGIQALALSVIFWVIGFLYNWRYKQAGLAGNLMVSSSVAVTFILGGMAAGQPWNKIVWFFGLIAFLIDLGEEIAGDAMDMEGDRKRGSRSIPILYGKDVALRISAALFGTVILISFLPYLLGWLGTGYLVIISITDVMTLFFTARLLKSQTPEEGCRWMRAIYLGALFAMLAFLIGQFLGGE
jgi:geranylgeranylglycerol-phosphate geranylgeranyltransferase